MMTGLLRGCGPDVEGCENTLEVEVQLLTNQERSGVLTKSCVGSSGGVLDKFLPQPSLRRHCAVHAPTEPSGHEGILQKKSSHTTIYTMKLSILTPTTRPRNVWNTIFQFEEIAFLTFRLGNLAKTETQEREEQSEYLN